MAMVQECVSVQQLRDYLLGRLDDQESERLESHLRDCAACDETAANLEADDTLARHLRSVADGDPPLSDERIAASAERVKKMAPLLNEASQAASGDDDVSGPPDADAPLGGYELLERIGVGGMGAVYRGRHQRLDRIVAIKLLPSRVAGDPAAIARFQREMRAAGRLDHPAIVAATDAGEHGGTHFLVMELVDGLDLARIARAVGPLPIGEACELIRQAAIGLDYAHSRGVVHRDVKPSNLMLDRQGRVKILDLGLAQLGPWQQPVDEGTTVGQLMGTLDYMAPEQAESGQPTDYRADLYSLGATLFRLLCGRAPHAVTPHLSPLEKLRLLATSEPPKLVTLRTGAPPELCRLVDQLLSRSPADRPGSAAVVAERLQPLCEGAATAALLDRARERLVDQPTENPSDDPGALATGAAMAAAGRGDSGNGRRGPKAWIGAAAMLPLLLLAAIVVVLETSKGQVVIESEAADVQVRLLRDGEAVDEFTVQQGASATRVRAGKYEVVIDGPSDQLTVDDNTFTLRRGETVVTRITRRVPEDAAAEPSARVVELPLVTELLRAQYELQMLRQRLGDRHPKAVEQQQRIEAIEKMLAATEAPATPAPAGPTYEGKTLDEWLAIFERERAPEEVDAALRAIRALANRESADKVAAVVLRVARQLPEDYFPLERSVFPILQKLNSPQTVMEHVLAQLSVDDPTWQRRILDGLGALIELGEHSESLDPLVDRVATLAMSQREDLSYAALRQLLNLSVQQQARGDSTEKVHAAWDRAMMQSIATEHLFANIVLEPTWPEWVQQSFVRWSIEQLAADDVADEVLIRAAVNIAVNAPLAVEMSPDVPQTIADQLVRHVDPLPASEEWVLVQEPFADPAAQVVASTVLTKDRARAVRVGSRIQMTPTLLLASLAAQPLLNSEKATQVFRKFLQQPGSEPTLDDSNRDRLLESVLSGKQFVVLKKENADGGGTLTTTDSVHLALRTIARAALGEPAEEEGREASDVEPKETPR